jgi:hypothetical protein
MDTRELLELDRFTALTVMGWLPYKKGCMHAAEGRTFYDAKTGMRHQWMDDCGPQWNIWQPTTNPADAMEVYRRCNEHINARKSRDVIGLTALMGDPMLIYEPDRISVYATTLELCIAKFAKQLFSK